MAPEDTKCTGFKEVCHKVPSFVGRCLSTEERSRHIRIEHSVPRGCLMLSQRVAASCMLSHALHDCILFLSSAIGACRLKEKGRIFREAFLAKLGLLLRGTVAAPPERYGETLADEHIRGGDPRVCFASMVADHHRALPKCPTLSTHPANCSLCCKPCIQQSQFHASLNGHLQQQKLPMCL